MKIVGRNRRASFDYELLDTFEAGLMLTGPEVKSVRNGHIQLAGSYVSFHGGKPVLLNSAVARYPSAASVPHEEHRARPLLLKKSEIRKLKTAAEEKGIAIIPLEVRVGKYVKVLLGVGRGRKRFDKRQRIKEREVGRKIREGREI